MTVSNCAVCELHAESTFKIEGMDCREEVARLERRFKNLVGLEDFAADLMGQRLHVKYDAARLSAASIADAVADTGMRAWLENEEPIGIEPHSRRRQILVWASGAALALGLLFDALLTDSAIALACFIASLALGVDMPARKAWNAVRAR